MDVIMEKKRMVWMDSLRIFATVAVIVIHVTGMHWMEQDVHSLNWDIYNVYRAMVRWAVPVFVMISGTTFLNPKKEIDLKKLYSHYIFRIVMAYFFWSVIYAIYEFNGSWLNFGSNIIHGAGHMWFLFLISWLYIMVPILRKIYGGGYLIISFILAFVMPMLLETVPMLLGYQILDKYSLLLLKIIQKVFGWTSYFMLGRCLNEMIINKKHRVYVYLGGILALISSVFVMKAYAYGQGYATNEIYDNISITVLIESIAIYVAMKYRKSREGKKRIFQISKMTFGIYLVHMLVFYFVDDIWFADTLLTPILSIPITVIIVFEISCLISYIIHKNPVFNKLFV